MSTGRQGARGLTRVDVLTVLALGALLLVAGGRLTSKPREQAGRMLCRANLGKIGKAMLIYANDYDKQLPRAGGRDSEWGPVNWDAASRYMAFGTGVDGTGGNATISSCFYLLVKHLEVPPRLFICPGDLGTSAFSLADELVAWRPFGLADAWDFGATPYDNCSYAYHMPFSQYPLDTSRDPNLAVAADRNPWIQSPAAEPNSARWSCFIPDVMTYGGNVEDARQGNANAHERDGQNVLFLDGRVTFEHRCFCGIDEDNLYTMAETPWGTDPRGIMPVVGSVDEPRGEKDSFLLHDPPTFGAARRR